MVTKVATVEPVYHHELIANLDQLETNLSEQPLESLSEIQEEIWSMV